jgi:hypothetical protein
MKRIPALVLCVLLLLPLFTSCAEKEEQTETAALSDTAATVAEDTADPAYVPDLPDMRFEGKTFTFLVHYFPCFAHLYDVETEDDSSDIVISSVFNRNTAIYDRYGVKIEAIKNDNAPMMAKNAFKANDDAYNAVWLKVDDFFSLSIEGAFHNYGDEVPYVDTSKSYWDQGVVNDFTYGGKLYGLMGDISTSIAIYTHLLVVDTTLANKLDVNLPELYDTVRAGDWTFDRFYGLLKSCSAYSDNNGNAIRDGVDTYALAVPPDMMWSFTVAAGEKWVVKDGNDYYTVAPLTERLQNVVNDIIDLGNDKYITVATWNVGSVPGVSDADTYGYTIQTKFYNSTALFTDADIAAVLEARANKDTDFGILPVPKYDQLQEKYSTYAYPFYPLLSVPAAVKGEKLEMTGLIIEALAAESYKTLTPAFYEKALSSKYVRDEHSYDMLKIILNSRIYDPIYFYSWAGGTFRDSLVNMLTGNKKTLSSYYARGSKSLNKALLKVYDKFVER